MSDMRIFPGGATRDLNQGKLAYTKFLSPQVLTAYCEYLERHRDTAHGRRDQDNWKAGIPIDVYFESLGRHFWEAWTEHESGRDIPMDVLSAILFNVMGIMHEKIKEENN